MFDRLFIEKFCNIITNKTKQTNKMKSILLFISFLFMAIIQIVSSSEIAEGALATKKGHYYNHCKPKRHCAPRHCAPKRWCKPKRCYKKCAPRRCCY